jgi:hypothetical protein
MNEALLERNRQLQRSLRRWRLACLALAIVVVSLVAIGGTFGTFILLRLPDFDEIEMLQAERSRERDHAHKALQAEQAAREETERVLQAARGEAQQEGKGDGP